MKQVIKYITLRGKRRVWTSRRGVVSVLAAFLLVGVFAFVAFAVDTGLIALTQSEMQNAVDAAALAASQEITGAIDVAGQGSGDATIDFNSIAVTNAREMAAEVAELNGVYVDPDQDVVFGKRSFDAATGTWPIEWGMAPYNVVKVSARRDNADTSQPGGRLPLSFGWAVGMSSVKMTTSATAFVQARDIELVLDFSASMNDDSSIRSFGTLGQSIVEASLDGMWDALITADPKWPGTTTSKFPASGFGQINSYRGTYVSSSSTNAIYDALGLNETIGEEAKYPFPQAGRYNSGLPQPQPSYNASRNLWIGYINYVKNLSGTYRGQYGYRTLLDYLQDQRFYSDKSEDLWRTKHYPFHGVKAGASLFLNFLSDLDFGDEIGLVSYCGYSQVETVLNDGDAYVDISSDPITGVYSDLDTILQHKQAGHYNGWTGMGYGIKDAKEMLIGDPSDSNDNGYARYGARPTMIIMTDGQTNQGPSNWSLPSGWDWADWTDYDSDGDADYSTTDTKKKYAFWEATEAIRNGVTVHTMSVGADADRDLMKAIAFAGSGVWMDVPGGTTVAEMEEQLIDAFRQIAAKVPPPKLIYSESD